jgi:hypothetical protein
MAEKSYGRLPESWFNVLLCAVVVVLLLAVAAWVPAFPCPSCVDLELFVPGCPCGSRPRSPQKMSLWKRWKFIRELEAEGCRQIPLLRRGRLL